ncbi:MAG TPA: hypothetical protein VES39_07395 [Rhodospirillales bacterium]|nr:hypothetical protein [Rhodospirillales bacterium]
MPFTLIRGRFRPLAGEPDGDSVCFLADDLALWTRLEGRPPRLGTGQATRDTVQLRFEGIDAIERGAIRPLSVEARDNMFGAIGFDRATDPEPRGWILARMTDDQSGRPICFVFAGDPDAGRADGGEVFLDVALLRRSVNWQQARQGFAYPLYYNTLFADLRREITAAVTQAPNDGLGYWPTDATLAGVDVTGRGDLARIPPIWPKLWRRLDEHLRSAPDLGGFPAFLEERDERVDVLSEMEERGVQDLVEVRGDRVRMTQPPENLRVVGSAGRRNR